MSKGSVTSSTLQTRGNKLGLNFGTLSLISVVAMVFVMGLVKIYSADLGFHLRSAEEILKNKKFIYTDTFSYGSEGHRYYDLQWLFQLLVYFLYHAGKPFLVIVNALLISFSIALTWLRFSRYSINAPENIRTTVFAFIALLFVLPLTFEIRPHVLSWTYLNLVLLTLESYKRGKKRALLFLPFIMLFWVNTHSLSILGLIITGIYNAGSYFENKRIDKKLLLISLYALIAFLINPYFFNGLLFPFKQFGFISGGLAKSYINEMSSPFAINELRLLGQYLKSSPVMLLQYLTPLMAVACLFRTLKQKNFTEALLLTAFLFLFNLGFKNYGYFLMVGLPVIARHTLDLLSQRRQRAVASPKEKNSKLAVDGTPAFNKKTYNGIAIATAFLCILIGFTCINNGYTISLHIQDEFGFTEDNNQLPVEAIDFLLKNKINGKILNHFNFGGYLLAHAHTKVFIDGRIELMDDDFFRDYYLSVTEQNGLKKLLDTFDPDIVMFPYLGDGATWWNYLLANKSNSGYKVVYFDGLSAIYLKSSAFPQIPELTAQRASEGLDVKSIPSLAALIRLPDKPQGIATWLQSIWKKQVLPVEDMKKSMFCFTNGFESAALVYSVRSLEHTTVHTPDVFYNLSVYCRQRNMNEEAQICESKIKSYRNN